MGRKSKIDKLPSNLKELIGKLREQGKTIDEILFKLSELDTDISRSGLGRYLQRADKIGERLRQTRAMADHIIKKTEDEPQSKLAQLNFEMMHDLIFRLMNSEDGEKTSLDAKEAMFLSNSLEKIAKAARIDLDRELTIKKEIAAKAATAVEKTAKKQGLSLETIEKLKAEVLGVAK
jgi:hypothetical protein